MRTAALLLAFLLVATVPARADRSLDHARQGQALLGPGVWSEVIRVENETRGGPYPRVFHALVFELAGRLWFYCDCNGTQSFSLYAGRLEQEKADFGPLLRDIDPGLARWTTVATPPAARVRRGGRLPNGCFLESVAALRERIEQGREAGRPRLLSYYVGGPAGTAGHTVLVYEAGGRVVVFDPAAPGRDAPVPAGVGAAPLDLARQLEGADVARARFLPLTPAFDSTAGHWSPLAERRTNPPVTVSAAPVGS